MNQRKVVVLTGAGVSAESGLKTFRDSNGLWEQHRVEEVATPEAFQTNPELVYRFYNARRQQLQEPDVQPNAAHQALARLEQHLGSNLTLVTQNVDDLHERAGSQQVLHMHGQLMSARCVASGIRRPFTRSFDATTACTCCQPANQLRPDIVWFGETPMFMDKIIVAVTQADLFIAIGTSGQVYPAAGFAQLAHESGVRTVELNLEPDIHHPYFDEHRQGPAGQVVPQFIDELIQTNA
ncbi:Sir2 family NAD+-dependent deacetylase [Salinimonas lutimaris]|uniref:Sir2 family NAD+-dependent deacetylase n=1 Tax=Salinimonas lutimaris TaxID=914153 RepID=UPI0010C0DA61|nr:Sir2 family NAD+-dependent deacetylase [Salinimonas lutimaris]